MPQRVGIDADFPEGCRRVVQVDHKSVLIVRHGGELFALDAVCPHAGGDLSQGFVEDGTITCRNHGTCFDLSDGRIRLDRLDEDILEQIDPDNLPFGPLRTYFVRSNEAGVFVELEREDS